MRRRMKTTVALVVAAVLAGPGIASTGRAATGTVVDEGWAPVSAGQTMLGLQGVTFRDEPQYDEAISTLRPRIAPNNWWKACTAITAEPCASAPSIDWSAVLQPCATATQLDCIVAFGTVDASGNKVPATYTGAFPAKALNGFPAEPSVGLPGGGAGGMWTVAESSGAAVRGHFLRVVVSGTTTPGKPVTFAKFAANVSPVAVTSFACGGGPVEKLSGCTPGDVPDQTGEHHGGDTSGWTGYVFDYGLKEGLDCVMTGNLDATAQKAECAVRKALNKTVTYYLTVRLSQAVSGWMHGRLTDPSITLEDVPGATGAVTLTVSGKPVSVPAVVQEKKFTDLPASLQDKYRANGGWPRTGGGYWGASNYGMSDVDANDPTKRNRRSNASPFGADSIAELEGWIPVVNDTAVADLSTWTVRTLGSGDLGAAQGCVTDKNKVTGIVTTNATVYKAGAPVYDATTKSLNYTVSAPHYMSSGDLFRGAYGLIIRSDVARCIYKFTSAPLKATIEVIDSGADKNTVVTNVSEANGWMRLMASGFTHSTPTIRAAFTQVTASTVDVRAGRSLTRSAMLKKAGLTATTKSRVTLSVASSSRKVCRVSGTSVRATAKGTCTVSVTVQTGAKRTKKTVRLTVG